MALLSQSTMLVYVIAHVTLGALIPQTHQVPVLNHATEFDYCYEPIIIEVPDVTHKHFHGHKPYTYYYKVLDEKSGIDFSECAVADKNGNVRGQYRILMADGRRQVTKYTAYWRGGTKANVTFEGKAAVYPST